ncbi:MAG: hypothetical protein ABL904_14215 [Hyphomicrobiaceae bacterium]
MDEVMQRILAELEEAGEENPAAMLNTILDPNGDQQQLIAFQSALRRLVESGLAAMSVDRDQSRRLTDATVSVSLTEIDALPTWLRFDLQKKYWADNRVKGPPFRQMYPQIVLTEAGRSASVGILTQRGYQWWRQQT